MLYQCLDYLLAVRGYIMFGWFYMSGPMYIMSVDHSVLKRNLSEWWAMWSKCKDISEPSLNYLYLILSDSVSDCICSVCFRAFGHWISRIGNQQEDVSRACPKAGCSRYRLLLHQARDLCDTAHTWHSISRLLVGRLLQTAWPWPRMSQAHLANSLSWKVLKKHRLHVVRKEGWTFWNGCLCELHVGVTAIMSKAQSFKSLVLV